jgi:hypothetical protein
MPQAIGAAAVAHAFFVAAATAAIHAPVKTMLK